MFVGPARFLQRVFLQEYSISKRDDGSTSSGWTKLVNNREKETDLCCYCVCPLCSGSRHQRRHDNRDSSLGSSFRRKHSTRSPSTGEAGGTGASGSERRRERRQRRERKPLEQQSTTTTTAVHRRSPHHVSPIQVGFPFLFHFLVVFVVVFLTSIYYLVYSLVNCIKLSLFHSQSPFEIIRPFSSKRQTDRKKTPRINCDSPLSNYRHNWIATFCEIKCKKFHFVTPTSCKTRGIQDVIC